MEDSEPKLEAGGSVVTVELNNTLTTLLESSVQEDFELRGAVTQNLTFDFEKSDMYLSEARVEDDSDNELDCEVTVWNDGDGRRWLFIVNSGLTFLIDRPTIVILVLWDVILMMRKVSA